MKSKCGWAKHYKGRVRPTCLGGRGCDTCWEIYRAHDAELKASWLAEDETRKEALERAYRGDE